MKTSSRGRWNNQQDRLEAKPERTRKKARSETKIQLDRYNNLSECAFDQILSKSS